MSEENRSDKQTIDDLMSRLTERRSAADLPTVELPELEGLPPTRAAGAPLDLGREVLKNVRLRVRVELGRTRMPLGAALGLSSGSLVELDQSIGQSVDIFVSDVPIARGQVLIVDGRFCIRVTEVLAPDQLSEVSREAGAS